MAYGVNAPFGLKPSVMNTGAPWNGQTNTYIISTTAPGTTLFTGDPVAQAADGGIVIGTGGTGIIGVFMGCQYVDSTGNYRFSPYWQAGTSIQSNTIPTAFVVDDPTVLFDIQVATSTPGVGHAPSVSQTDLNRNANFVVGTGSTISGQSGAYLDSVTINTTVDLSLKILRVTPAFTNQAGTLTSGNAYTGGQNILGLLYNNVLVQINNDVLKGGTGTLGV